MKRPDDDTYPFLAVNYLKLNKVPAYNESWAPIVEGIDEGNLCGTTGDRKIIQLTDTAVFGTKALRIPFAIGKK